jgi:hypothetical protein
MGAKTPEYANNLIVYLYLNDMKSRPVCQTPQRQRRYFNLRAQMESCPARITDNKTVYNNLQ